MRHLYIVICIWTVVAKPKIKKEVLENLKTHEEKSLKSSINMMMDHLDARKKKAKIVWRDWEELQKPGKWHKNMIKDWYDHPHDQDDPIANLLQTMIVHDKQGNPHTPEGIDTSKKISARAEDHDGHIYPKELKDGQHSKDKRNFAERVRLWEYAYVPYSINSAFTKEQRETINSAIKEFADKSCISFVQRQNTNWIVLPHRVYLYFTYGDSCSSAVGRISSGQQKIELDPSYCFKKKTVIHEIMHALGQVHEQQRMDRDNHVIMHWDRIRLGKKNLNMEKLPIGSHDRTPYDPSSILQYGLRAFSKTGGKTMTLRDKRLEPLVGSSDHLTHLDAKEVNLAYRCSAKCPRPPLCQNGGYVNEHCSCVCPDGLIGTECREVHSDRDCGGILAMNTVDFQNLKSLRYPDPYPVDKECAVLITAPKGSKIKLEVVNKEMNLRKGFNNVCLHWIEVRYISPEIIGPKFCDPFSPIVSKSNQMMIRFNSKLSKDYYPYFGQKFFLRLSTGNPIHSSGVKCNFDGSSPCRMEKTQLKERKNVWWVDPSYGAENSPGYAYIDTQTTFTLTTPSGTFSDGYHCIRFSFYIRGSPSRIGIREYGASSIWSTSSPTDGHWLSLKGNYRATPSSRLQIYGSLYSDGIVALDEVQISSGKCSE
ncbi:zinc metalloproteinase nas-36-like [Ostrea edulis]|uniref:zinc metalloproteinase nas-36-like n=1 Tax=Ostrea edulis TaxID=37623 RepID=UPI0024AF2340|nr:zinc metalloproteinase nas-36-like [Ostrea edulis]